MVGACTDPCLERLSLLKFVVSQVIVLGYDDLEPLSGIPLKIKAFRRLLNIFPEYRTKILLVQVRTLRVCPVTGNVESRASKYWNL